MTAKTKKAEFFANMLLQLFSGHLGQANGYAQVLPSFWFLGIYETIAPNMIYTGTGQNGQPNLAGTIIYRIYIPDHGDDDTGGGTTTSGCAIAPLQPEDCKCAPS